MYPKRTWGRYRKLKWVSMVLLLTIYYVAPFLRYNRGEFLPNQAILIDMAGRRGYFFGLEIWPHEVYYLAGILILAAIGLFFVSALLGRVWCGYACPQTVWTDLFVWVERIIQGDRNARMKLDNAPLSFEKIWKKSITHCIWLLIGFFTGGAWVLYFNDAPTLIRDALHLNISLSVALWVGGLTLSTYVMAGYAREQVCTYMCPYARFQSAMFDKDTLVITYDTERGEPRGKHKAGDSWEGRGDCIDCDSCVVVCPTGIDIRNGLQMECIACGLCVDACNNVMDKIDRPRGLIRYDTQNNQVARMAAHNAGKPFKDALYLVRPRTLYYCLILLTVSGIMLYGFATRPEVALHVLHDRNPLFVKLKDGTVRNDYTIKILNMSHTPKQYSLSVEGLEHYDVSFATAGNEALDMLATPADSVATYRVFIAKMPDVKTARKDIALVIKDTQSNASARTVSFFINKE